MSSTTRSERGLLCIAGAIALGIVSFLFPYVWDVFLPASGFGEDTFYHTLHVLWIPLTSVVLLTGSAVLFVLGFLLVWRDRALLDPRQRAVLRLATLAFAVSAGAAGVRTFLGVIIELVSGPGPLVLIPILNVGLAITTGLTLYWLLLGEGVRQARLTGIIALVAGSVSSVLAIFWRATGIAGAGVIGVTAGFLSLTLWLALFLWGYEELRLRGVSRPPGLPA